jgi:hypothetical protein
MSGMSSEETSPAPRWRRALAGLADIAIVVGVAWLRRRRGDARGPGDARLASLSGSAGELIREQLGSPGQRLFGVRTVDRRTGERVTPWRTLLLFGARAGGELLVGRLARVGQTPERERERERFMEEMRALNKRHPPGSPGRNAELSALTERSPGPVIANPAPAMAAGLAMALINSRLRRRLAPTTEVAVRR